MNRQDDRTCDPDRRNVMARTLFILGISSLLFFLPLHLNAEEKKQGPPAARVVTSEVTAGFVAPEKEFIGTVYYREVSHVAAEVSGVAEVAGFEEGQKVKKNEALIVINSDLLEKTLQSTKASHEQVLADLESERKTLQRVENLFKESLISEQSYDDHHYRVKGLERKSASLQAEVERLEVELGKTTVVSPFDGVIMKKFIQTGDWLSPGKTITTIGKDDYVDVVAEVPEESVVHIKKGLDARVLTGRGEMTGKVFSIVPQGDVTTRTIPVKVRLKNTAGLFEGMEARVFLPVGQTVKTLIVPRDAVVPVYGETVVFVIDDSKARMIPVKVYGYEEMNAGVQGEGLLEGMRVVIKGNERLRDGQAITDENTK